MNNKIIAAIDCFDAWYDNMIEKLQRALDRFCRRIDKCIVKAEKTVVRANNNLTRATKAARGNCNEKYMDTLR